MKDSFKDFILNSAVVLFPGGMGTELQRRGHKTYLPLWSAAANTEAPELVTRIHDDYFAAGADIAVTNTFRTTPRTYDKIGKGEAEAREALQKSVICARDAADKITTRPVFVAGSIAPLEDCYEPDLVPDRAALEQEHGVLAKWLAEEGVDFLLLETINAKAEAAAMAKAAAETGLPYMISFVVDASGTLLDGTSLDDTIAATDHPGRAGVMINCRPMAVLSEAYKYLDRAYAGPKGFYANGTGRPDAEQGWIFDEDQASIDQFTESALSLKEAGAKIIGGCCGTTPAYIEALKKKLA